MPPPDARPLLPRLAAAALLVLGPKCILCVLAWLGVMLGLAGPELCGAP
jgi:hypothetical protein